MFQLPTGGGKTVVFTHIARAATAKGARICVLVHRAELRKQASKALKAFCVPHGVVRGRRNPDDSQLCWVSTIQTLARRLDRLRPEEFDLLIVDEAHHAAASEWRRVIEAFPRARILGVSATPCRLDGLGLGGQFDEMVCGPEPAWLVDQGFLAPSRVFAPPIGFDPKAVRRRGKDLNLDDAEGQIRTKIALGDCVRHYGEHLSGNTAVAFCCSIAHAEAVAEAFNNAGVPAASIDGRMKDEERESLLERLGSGEIKVLTSCELIGEGIDIPSVGGCILLRPTLSVALFLQMVGRALRPAPGKVAVILDHVGNYARHGHHLARREWTLEAGIKKRAPGERALSLWVCTNCFATMESQQKVCDECGSDKPVIEERIQVVEGRLVEIKLERERRERERKQELKERRREQAKCQTLSQLVELAQSRGHRRPVQWARHILQSRRAKRTGYGGGSP